MDVYYKAVCKNINVVKIHFILLKGKTFAWDVNPPSLVPGVGQLTPAPTAARYGHLNDFIHIFSGKSQFYIALKFVLFIDIYSKEPVFLKQ